MRTLPLVLVLASCGQGTAFRPECVESGRVHACSDVWPRSCTLMMVLSGLDVAFEAPVAEPYEVGFVADGSGAGGFRCEPASVDGGTEWQVVGDGWPVWQCGADGFSGGPTGDEIAITVTVDGHEPVTTTVEPCWDVSEPNGRCCGFAYSATVTVPAFTN